MRLRASNVRHPKKIGQIDLDDARRVATASCARAESDPDTALLDASLETIVNPSPLSLVQERDLGSFGDENTLRLVHDVRFWTVRGDAEGKAVQGLLNEVVTLTTLVQDCMQPIASSHRGPFESTMRLLKAARRQINVEPGCESDRLHGTSDDLESGTGVGRLEDAHRQKGFGIPHGGEAALHGILKVLPGGEDHADLSQSRKRQDEESEERGSGYLGEPFKGSRQNRCAGGLEFGRVGCGIDFASDGFVCGLEEGA